MRNRFDLHLGDCLEVMPTLAADSVDSIVSDPPYGLSFMGKGWDHGVPGQSFWAEALRVAKPGAHLLAFGGTRTYHRLACSIEDAGWEIRDCVMWVYGSGFPKSHDVSKAIDKMDAAEEQQARRYRFTAWVRSTGATARQIDETTGTRMGSHYTTHPTQPAIMTREHLEQCRHLLGDVPEWVEREADIRSVESKNFAEREIVGEKASGLSGGTGHTVGRFTDSRNDRGLVDITAPATDAARQWSGWGTALKPAYEPIIVARKPLEGTVATNVLKHGTGAINVDGCRVEVDDPDNFAKNWDRATVSDIRGGNYKESKAGAMPMRWSAPTGRWPANVIHDGSEDVESLAGSAARFFYCAKASKADRDEGLEGFALRSASECCEDREPGSVGLDNPRAGAGRINGARNIHPTVKPTSLMRYLCRLVTPPGGVVLDPFTGSGSTGKGAMLEGFRFIGIERESDYLEIARARIDAATKSDNALPLFQEELACV
jgi:DNA modification methylase